MIIETDHEVIYMSGALRANQWPAIKTTAYLVYASYPMGVTLDFGGVRCVSVGGESTFLDALADIERHELPFALSRVPPEVAARLQQKMGNFSDSRRPDAGEESRIRQAIGSETWWRKLWGAT